MEKVLGERFLDINVGLWPLTKRNKVILIKLVNTILHCMEKLFFTKIWPAIYREIFRCKIRKFSSKNKKKKKK